MGTQITHSYALHNGVPLHNNKITVAFVKFFLKYKSTREREQSKNEALGKHGNCLIVGSEFKWSSDKEID